MIVLEPFQAAGARFMATHPHCLNADDPGLFKTGQAIIAADIVNAKSILVAAPASVRSNWHEFVEMHFGHTRGWDIISYNEAGELARAPKRDVYDVFIGDEIHFCKTMDSQRTRAIFGNGRGNDPLGLIRRAHWKWPMTGTWAPNGRPVELYPVLKTLHPAFKEMSFAAYAQRYCGAYWDGRGLNVKGASRLEELADLLKGFILRRTEAEVYPDRKDPLVERVILDLSADDLALVNAAEDEIGGREARISSRYEEFSQLGDTSTLLRLLGTAKARHACSFVEDLLDTVDKVVVFAHHIDVMRQLMLRLSVRGHHPVLYRGGMSDRQKDDAVNRFVKDAGCHVFVGQDSTAGTGINGLQHASSTVVFVEPSWVPGETKQRIKRLARTGQREPLVKAYMLYAKGTLDGVVYAVHDRKEKTGAAFNRSSDPLGLGGLGA